MYFTEFELFIFSKATKSKKNGPWQKYSNLDYLNRAHAANALLNSKLMPRSQREPLYVNPTGWHNKRIASGWLYNRCHLIGYQLTAENANDRNLITGTRYFNATLMLPYENMVADYIKETNNHVLYRVTPVFEGNNLVATGVQMEAKSVEDNGEGIEFNVFVYNYQPGIHIDYLTGKSWIE